MDETNRAIGARLRKARITRSMTLEQLSAATGGEFSVSTLVGYELGNRNIGAAKLQTLAQTLGCEVSQFFPPGDSSGHETRTIGHVVTGHPRVIDAFAAHIAGVAATAFGLDIAPAVEPPPTAGKKVKK